MLTLRPLQSLDEPDLVNSLNNPNVTRFLSSNIPQPYSSEDARWWVDTGCNIDTIVRAIEWDGSFCGTVGVYLQKNEYAHAAELGYWLDEAFWGRGIATQAVEAFINWLAITTAITRIYNPVTSSNLASIRVMEKLGFVCEGRLRNSVTHNGAFFDELLFAKIVAPVD
ncbi:GNAT family N-acetyltransferase [Alteromonas facilis]|uniref:GNAT family N-acetyltransferase n=1 Tax=Alteromonas facilis TaxID=2048004 RepID=UPI000C28587C|nr:GNAT family N-acetyltransferase [Alteromonas facilis]